MAKILWYGDACCNTGFARVTHSILEYLCKDHEVSVVGLNATGDPHDYPFTVYPAANVNCGDRFGIPRLPEILTKVRPDFFFCLQDIWICNQVWERVQFLKDELKFKFVTYFPIDSEAYYVDMLRNIPAWDMAVTFTVESAKRILDHGIQTERLGVIPHGVDVSRFNEIPRAEARSKLGLGEDKFIVLNANRNQPRKCMDLTIKAFAKFAVDKPDTMLYMHMGAKDMGWDIIPLFVREMNKNGLDHTNRMALTSQNINYMDAPSDELLNTIYNCCDVGINTSNGEGWGLVSFEHASCKKPQIVPNHTACFDIWNEAAMLTDISTWVVDKDLGVERGLIDVDHAARQLTELYTNKETYDEVAEACYAVTQRKEYRWENVAAGFNQVIKDLGA